MNRGGAESRGEFHLVSSQRPPRLGGENTSGLVVARGPDGYQDSVLGMAGMERRALGIDPGTALMGYAVVRQRGERLDLLACGALETTSDNSLPERLAVLYDGLLQIIDEHQPTELAIEDLFFNRNVRTALSVGQARGVALLAGQHRGLSVASYTPLQVKQSVAGFGRARKDQIQEMVRILLNLSAVPQPDDAADAAAIAVCHLHSAHSRDILKELSPALKPTTRVARSSR